MAETVTVDAKGRVSIPRAVRQRLGLHSGATLFVQEHEGEIRFRRAENPFDLLAEYAEEEYRMGQTTSLRVYASEHGIALGGE
jgi:AbrB family looped-hinge helix DNA binding protein